MARGYLSEQELYEIECAIFNDDNKALFKSLPEGIEDKNNGDVVKELAKGKEYYILPETNIMLRQDGALYNVRFVRQLKPLWTPHDLIINGKGKQIRYTDIYKKKGWEFNHEEIVRRFIEHNWQMSVTYGYMEKWKELYF